MQSDVKDTEYNLTLKKLESLRKKILLLTLICFVFSVFFIYYRASWNQFYEGYSYFFPFIIIGILIFFIASLRKKAQCEYENKVVSNLLGDLCQNHEGLEFIKREKVNEKEFSTLPIINYLKKFNMKYEMRWGFEYRSKKVEILVFHFVHIFRFHSRARHSDSQTIRELRTVFLNKNNRFSDEIGIVKLSKDMIRHRSLIIPQVIIMILFGMVMKFMVTLEGSIDNGIIITSLVGAVLIIFFPKVLAVVGMKLDKSVPGHFDNISLIKSAQLEEIGNKFGLENGLVANLEEKSFIYSDEYSLNNGDLKYMMTFPILKSINSNNLKVWNKYVSDVHKKCLIFENFGK